MLFWIKIPVELQLGILPISLHWLLEYLAFFMAYRYYQRLKQRHDDGIASTNRLSIILGAAIGALLGSRIVGFLEQPIWPQNAMDFLTLTQVKTIMGGLFGGLIGVEIAKKIINERRSSGNLMTLPIILGIFIGRIGCFLSGTKEFTYGKPTSFFMGMDLGDGLLRHPTALYELLFLIPLFFILQALWKWPWAQRQGNLFKLFMLSYFSFRFFIEFLKPNAFFILGLSSIQWLCILCWIYYAQTIKNWISHAR